MCLTFMSWSYLCCSMLFQESGKKLGDKFENFGDKLKKVHRDVCSLLLYRFCCTVRFVGHTSTRTGLNDCFLGKSGHQSTNPILWGSTPYHIIHSIRIHVHLCLWIIANAGKACNSQLIDTCGAYMNVLNAYCRLRLWTRVGRVWKREQKEFMEWWWDECVDPQS